MRPPEDIVKQAIEHFRLGQYDEAVFVYDKLLAHIDEPDFNILLGYGTSLAALKQYGLAIHLLRQAVDKHPNIAPAWINLGLALKGVNRDSASLNCYHRALDIDPKSAEALANISGWWVNHGEPEKVIDFAERSLALSPNLADAQVHLALGLLESGRFDEAWPHYEHRWNIAEQVKSRRPYTAAKWDGRWVGKLAIHGEQGLGDEILFMSCFKEAAKRADHVVVECADRLINVFEKSFGVKCYPNHAELIAAEGEPDAYVAMGSLPGLVGYPDGRPHLIRPRYAVKGRIGIAWRGGVSRTNKRERSLKLDALAPILALKGFEFVSVQYGEEDIDKAAEEHGLPQALKGRSIDHSAEAIASCELVITVCQTAVHLAGAMGVPCWVMVPKQCAWRYGTSGERMRWYESVKLYRQDDTETWAPVIERIAQDLTARRT